MRARLRRCLYTVDSLKRLTHTVTHTRKRADGSSGNMGAKEYFNSSGNGQKRLENNIFRIFLLFVISRSGVRVRLPAPIFPQRSKVNMGEFPSGQRGQTVNLLSVTSVVRIHLPPPKSALKSADFCFIRTFWRRTETADAACFCAGSLNSSSFHAAFVHNVRSRQLGLMSSTQRH